MRPMLTIDLEAIRANWRAFAASVAPGRAGAVVKANAYGVGATEVLRVLFEEGCRVFFTANAEEAIWLMLKPFGRFAIYTLNGHQEGVQYGATLNPAILRPVLNSLDEIRAAAAEGVKDCAVQIDCGMARLGLSEADLEALIAAPDMMGGLRAHLIIGHLSCSDDPANPANEAQLKRFQAGAKRLLNLEPFRGADLSLSATGGALLKPDFTFDLTRPGIGLYGAAPFDAAAGGRPALRLEASVLQVRGIEPGDPVGYGASWRAKEPTRVAIVAMGYADGLPRALAGSGFGAWSDGIFLPLIGRVSMDLATLDATAAPMLKRGDRVEFFGKFQSLDHMAACAGTIGYEILTGLGPRVLRHYEEGAR